jgi:hypothetical protein
VSLIRRLDEALALLDTLDASNGQSTPAAACLLPAIEAYFGDMPITA